MFNTSPTTFSFNFRDIIIEEISLDGLEGIGLDLLWKRISKRISAPVTEKMQCRYWNLILKLDCITLYKLPVPLPKIEVLDRFTIIGEETGDLREPEDYVDGPYEYNQVEGDYGSCVHYFTRTKLDKADITKLSYPEVLSQYGDKLVLVASLEERWAALSPHLPITYLNQLTSIQFCILELIGKSRENGQMTIGKTNLSKIIKDAKLLFYNRKVLQGLDLIRVTHLTHLVPEKGGVKGILLRLKRFHKSIICTIPKTGHIFNLVEYLKEQPNYCEKTEIVLKKGLLSQKQNKKFQKKFYIFGFEERSVDINEMNLSKTKLKPHTKRRYIYLSSYSDESSDSEEEDNKVPLKCQYKVGVNILRQAYERFLEAGLNGLTQNQLSQLVGVEFYVSRTICRLFKAKNIVREYLEDKGRQRTAKFIAVAATAPIDSEYAEELSKLEKYIEETKNKQESDTESDPIPKKKRKVEQKDDNSDKMELMTEVTVIDGLPSSNINITLTETIKKMTLRQLKFANAILKIIEKMGYVSGYLALGKMASEEINEPPMDIKALKTLLQKFVVENYLKIYNIKWPGFKEKNTILLCSPRLKTTEPPLKTIYKETIIKAAQQKDAARRKVAVSKPLTQYAYPRFVKLQKLHEAIMQYAYFDGVKKETNDLPEGCVYIRDLIPELPIEVALGNLSSAGSLDIAKFAIDDSLLSVKICEAPTDLCKSLTSSSHLCNSLRSVIKTLALFGLVQLMAQGPAGSSNVPDNCLAIYLFYANKHATLIDTSGVWPKHNVEVQNYEKKFHFRTFEDVKDYWSTVYNISANTTIDLPNRNLSKQPKVPIRLHSEVHKYDNGALCGNQLGPCGLDSSIYLDLPRLWRSYCMRTKRLPVNSLIKPVIRIPKFDKKKLIFKKKLTAKPKPKKALPTDDLIVKMPTFNQIRLRDILKKQTKLGNRLRSPALWTIEEDRMIMMCRAAMNIMSPISQPGSLQIRNLVTKDILSIKDPMKTQQICHRRAAVIDCKSTLLYDKDCIMAELKLNYPKVLKKYEGMLKKLRILHTSNVSKYVNGARLPMMELVWIIQQVYKNITLKKSVPSYILDEDFFRNFSVVPSAYNRPTNTYKTNPYDEVIGPLKEAIVLTVMLSYNNVVEKTSAEKLFYNFDRYDEKVLRSAVDQLRKSGAVSAKDKMWNSVMSKADSTNTVYCWYKVSAQYQRRWTIKLNSEFAEDLAKCYDLPISDDNLKFSAVLNCFCCELLTKEAVEIYVIAVPVISCSAGTIMQEEQLNSIDIETKFKLKSGTLGWKTKKDIKKFSDLYKHINIENPITSMMRKSIVENVDRKFKMDKNMSDIEQKIVTHLSMKCAKGATFQKLKEICKCEPNNLIQAIKKMEEKNVIKRVGIYENIFVLLKYCKTWCMILNNKHILTKPWIDLNLKVRRDIFFKWTSVVMTKIFDYPGSSFSKLSESCEFISAAAIQDICEVLWQWECVILRTAEMSEPDLFSDDDSEVIELKDYNPYESPQNIYVWPVPDCLVKYAYIKKMALNASE